MARQLAFALPLRAARGRADFFVAPSNAVALAAIEGWRDWPGGRMLLIGGAGAGKTHLAHVCAAACAGAVIVPAADLAGADIGGLAGAPGVVVEDGTGSNTGFETALFHLLNLAGAEGGRVLITATAPPRDWGIALPDLQSRLDATPQARLDPPCDALLAAVLVKLFADRQIAVDPGLIRWLVPRMTRSLAAAGRIVDLLDATALARGQAVTRALAARVLGADLLDMTGESGNDA